MHIEELRSYCLSFSGTTEGFPFGEDVLVFKVAGKMFALVSLNSNPLRINLKCEPQLAVELRESYPAVEPGYHMNKQHWNSVNLDGSIKKSDLQDWIKHSYNSIVESLPKKAKEQLLNS